MEYPELQDFMDFPGPSKTPEKIPPGGMPVNSLFSLFSYVISLYR